MVFLTEFHKVDVSQVSTVNKILFNRYFYCIDIEDSEIGCKCVLIFGTSRVPIINLNDENVKKFEILWKVFIAELQSKADMQIEM